MEIQLTGVVETLLITVRVRAEETLRKDSLLQDPYAVEILEKLNFDKSSKNKVAASSHIGIVIRTVIFDNIIGDFFKRKPDEVIVNLGCGLDARYKRLNLGDTKWYDIDVEEAIDIRKQFFQEEKNYKMMPMSMFNFSWMQYIPKDRPILIISEGVMMYFPERKLEPLFNKIFETFPNVEMALDTIAPFLAKRTKLHSEVKKYNAKFQWGLNSEEDLKRWNNKISVLDVKYYFDYYKNRWPISIRLLMLFPNMRKWNKIVHIGNSLNMTL